MKKLFVLTLVLAALASCACAETWTVVGTPSDPAQSIQFTFSNNALSLNRASVAYGSTSYQIDILPGLVWAACGTYQQDGTFTADPYAQFVESGWATGSVQWAPSTPVGHEATFNIGKPGDSPLRMVVVTFYPEGQQIDFYPQWHTFSATYVPEPSGMAALVVALGAMGSSLRRRRG